jgi:ferredoxin-type protein NapG
MQRKITMKRRSTLKWLVYSASLLASGVIPIAVSRLMTPETPINPKRHLRLPGALNDDQAFNAACIGCGLCGEVCPPRCIQFHQRDGGAKANTP